MKFVTIIMNEIESEMFLATRITMTAATTDQREMSWQKLNESQILSLFQLVD